MIAERWLGDVHLDRGTTEVELLGNGSGIVGGVPRLPRYEKSEERRQASVTVDKVLLLSESAMIRAPDSLGFGRPHAVAKTPMRPLEPKCCI
jgi:hypothetical protein